ncbi:MAG: magnesium protoporphyrin IX methyltransferase [Pseudomonadota bacterium]
MSETSYHQRRAEIEHYFDRTAVDAWSRLTTTDPVSRIRQTVREGRDEMRLRLLNWLPKDLTGLRVLDAGCGTGLLSVDMARRGANVLAVDLSPQLIELARERLPRDVGSGRINFVVGDMASAAEGEFDHIVAMDSLIHYAVSDGVNVLAQLAPRVRGSILFTHAPATPLLRAMHAAGKLFPRSDRSPAIQPVSQQALRKMMGQHPALEAWHEGRAERTHRGFYISQAQELVRR